MKSIGLVLSASEAAIEDPAAMFFDVRSTFERWLTSVDANYRNPGERQPTLETFSESDCDVIFEGVLQVDSLVKGNIRSAYGTLMIGKEGRVEADVDVRIAIIDGSLKGELRATDYVVLETTARVSGNVHTPSLEIKDGAVFDGSSFFIEQGIHSAICTVETETEVPRATAVGA
jgi:cytoskeletal protein CcmA (bactofilin family)